MKDLHDGTSVKIKQECIKNASNTVNTDNHDGVITHLEPDILECKVRWALESITPNKVVEVMEFQLSYFRS